MSSDADDKNIDYISTRSRLRYSNRERRLIQRKQYESILNDDVKNDKSLINNIFEKKQEDVPDNKNVFNKIVISTNNQSLITTDETIVVKKTNHDNIKKKINTDTICNNS